ncbi:MAG: plasmid stabilization protein ParE [Cypionkella sp.]|uniref:type II toxin-antitoxin system RelE/ParE family toxin n=1 Tax=Cypionkella sp. TaxID=2811411 RepID=UPI0026054D0E|nr:type II toxin-antitoxin system RelE/ParE family toxin [Cypionkella sp.]MDB5661622.1 plasmid stabilization protein ParE [Cypionkella sp.]
MTIRLSRRALLDIEDIRAYTIDRWAAGQWLRYFAGLAAAMERIAEDPNCGRPRDLMLMGMRSMPHEKHVIFFLPAKTGVGSAAILRIVHQRRNLAALLYYENLDG